MEFVQRIFNDVWDTLRHGLKVVVDSTFQTDGSQKTQVVENPPTDSTKSNPSLVLTQTDNVVASTKPLTMTIGTTTYTATLSYNATGQFLSISSWS